jgi:hypothetical protein
VGLFLAGALLFWLVLVVPARLYWGRDGEHSAVVWQSLLAVALCLLPATLTLVWAGWAARQSPEQQLAAVVFGTMLRMVFVLAGGLVLYFRVPICQDALFWGWVLVFYLFTLALEMTLLLVPRAPAGNVPG